MKRLRLGRQRGFGAVQITWVLAGLLVAAAAACHIVRDLRNTQTSFSTPYQAILLANGTVYFGQLQDYGTNRPILRQVYYVISETNANTKQTNNVLVKRGKELHEPDRMYLNPNQIVFVEPVG
ncbi:MAG TPA: hypothetical protein VJP02_20060, partial [Candidatus Sulfotelmatobacter sp.]|nr:hypothetical protein [Candidatus Sulfotelmatobacter sp.]